MLTRAEFSSAPVPGFIHSSPSITIVPSVTQNFFIVCTLLMLRQQIRVDCGEFHELFAFQGREGRYPGYPEGGDA
jgi:hypothetical protein